MQGLDWAFRTGPFFSFFLYFSFSPSLLFLPSSSSICLSFCLQFSITLSVSPCLSVSVCSCAFISISPFSLSLRPCLSISGYLAILSHDSIISMVSLHNGFCIMEVVFWLTEHSAVLPDPKVSWPHSPRALALSWLPVIYFSWSLELAAVSVARNLFSPSFTNHRYFCFKRCNLIFLLTSEYSGRKAAWHIVSS